MSSKMDLTVLIACVGRRVELVQAFRRAATALGLRLKIVATDVDASAPALRTADVPLIAPRIDSGDYISFLLDLVEKHEICGLLPTIDTDLPLLAANRQAFADRGCAALVADESVINICRDKQHTYDFLHEYGFDTPATYSLDAFSALATKTFPYIIKPRAGSAGIGVNRVDDEADVHYLRDKVDDPVIQELVPGVEHTLDAYVGLTGEVRCIVPRRRLAVRGGEVSKGLVVKDPEIMEAGRQVVVALGRSVRGLVTLQCFVTEQRDIRFIEINARFGGGAPLGIAAGADYPKWLLQELRGETPEIAFDGFADGTMMLRYDWSAFLQVADNQAPTLGHETGPYPEFSPSEGA